MNSTYTFQYFSRPDYDSEGEFPSAKSVNNTLEFNEGATWDSVLREFLDFLSSIYGYDISKHVDVQTFEQRMSAFNNED